MKLWLCIFAGILLCSARTSPLPTGPSSAEALIIPIAYADDGAVLCKTHYTVNEMGAHMLMAQEYQWLVVDAKGLWEEYDWVDLPSDLGEVDYDLWDSVNSMDSLFDLQFAQLSKHPDLQEVLKTHRFTHAINAPMAPLTYTWKKGHLYDRRGRDRGRANMRAIRKLTPDGVESSPIPCTYNVKGVLFFQNGPDSGPSYFYDQFEYGIEMYTVTGVCTLSDGKW